MATSRRDRQSTFGEAALAGLSLDRADREPLHRQLASELKRLILAQTIASGARLPSSRIYAEELGVSRATVVAAIEELIAEGYAEGRHGSGVFVAPDLPDHPWNDIGLGGIVVEPTDDLLRLQQEPIDAVAPFTEKTGTAAAFVTTPEDPEINQPTIDYVAAFVPEATGKKFNPHVTIGVAPQDYLKKMLAEPFDVFTFSPTSASVYQLGNFGTARKELKALNP